MNQTIQNAAAVQMDGEDDRYPILGYLAWYSLRDVMITREDLGRLFDRHGISRTKLPAKISPANAFRRATRKVHVEQIRKRKEDVSGTSSVVMIRNVANNEREIVKHIIAEIRDLANKKLSYETVGTLIFDKTDGMMRGTALAKHQKVVDRATEYYEEMCKFYNGVHIRAAVRGMVWETNPVKVRPTGGVFFVSKEHKDLIESLEGMVAETNAFGVERSGEALFESIPLMDLEKQRKMIFDKYESQCELSVDATLAELATLLKSDATPSKKVIARYIDNAKSLKAGIESYEGLLERDMNLGRAKLSVLQHQTNALLNKAAVSELPKA